MSAIAMTNRPIDSRLIDNHIEFFRHQRGQIRLDSDFVFIDSDKEDYRIAILDSEGIQEDVLVDANVIYLRPWVQGREYVPKWPSFEMENPLRYMSTSPKVIIAFCATEPIPSFTVERVECGDALKEFTHVQTASFTNSRNAYANWLNWTLAMNEQAIQDSDHRFWLLRDRNQSPTSCVISVHTDGIIGLYGVGTLPEARRVGYSSMLLQFIADQAVRAEIPIIALQVVVGSYAESFYEKIGFNSEFLVHVLRRRATDTASNFRSTE